MGWLDTYQNGGKIKDERFEAVIPHDNTSVGKPMFRGMKQMNVRNKTDKEIAQERQAKIDESIAIRKIPYTKDNWRQKLSTETQAIGDKFRFSLKPNIVDDYLNPAVWIGDMASNLGGAPLQAEQSDSILPYVTSVGTPLVAGAVGGYGVKSNKEFLNQLVNPLSDFKHLAELRHKNVNFQFNNPFNLKNLYYQDLKQGAKTLDESIATKIKDLKTSEGKKRLVDMEENYLIHTGLPYQHAKKQALVNYDTRLNELAHTQVFGNKNSTAIESVSPKEFKTSKGADKFFSTVEQLDIPKNNAHFHPSPLPMEDYMGRSSIGGYETPGELTLGYGYGKSKPTAAHEIQHALQRNREMFLDKELKQLTPLDNLSSDTRHQAQYFFNGSKGMESSAFLAEARQVMKQDGLINHEYDQFTPDLVEKAYHHFKKSPTKTIRLSSSEIESISHHRIFDFMKPSPENFKLLSDSFNKLPAVLPVIGAGALAEDKLQDGGIIKDDRGQWEHKSKNVVSLQQANGWLDRYK